jgi:hypothetical protein
LLPNFAQARFLTWLTLAISRVRVFSNELAVAVGQLILRHRWKAATEKLIQSFGAGRTDLRPALLACNDLLSWWDRFRYSLSHTSTDNEWQLLRELVCELYPWGPEERELWQRSGGRNKDLQRTGDGETRWYDALKKIQHGTGISVARLLQVMRQDFPSNEQLRYLAEKTGFGETH